MIRFRTLAFQVAILLVCAVAWADDCYDRGDCKNAPTFINEATGLAGAAAASSVAYAAYRAAKNKGNDDSDDEGGGILGEDESTGSDSNLEGKDKTGDGSDSSKESGSGAVTTGDPSDFGPGSSAQETNNQQSGNQERGQESAGTAGASNQTSVEPAPDDSSTAGSD